MERIVSWIENTLIPKVGGFSDSRYFRALKRGFMVIMPLTIIGSIFLLITDFPLPGYADFMANIFGENWTSYVESAYRATFNSMGFILAATFAYSLAETYEMDGLTSAVLSVVSYIIVTPKEVTTESGEIVSKVLSFDWLGTQGVITALLVGTLTVEVIRFVYRKGWTIKMPDSVPSMVSQSFSSLIPGFMVVTVMLVLSGVARIFANSLPELIYRIIQIPLEGLTASLFAITIVAGLNGFLWWFGIHPTVVNSIVNPLLNANAISNQGLYEANNLTLTTGNVGTIQMIDQFATIGGAGLTIGLVLAILFVAKSERMKGMQKLITIPALFNINEPIIFGLPVVFNPLMIIPITLAPMVSVLIAYLAMRLQFMPMFRGVMAPWPTPPIISGFLVSGWQGAVVQIISIAASVVIYYPFVKALDNQFLKEEK